MNHVKAKAQHSLAIFCSAMQWEIDSIYALACQLAAEPFEVSQLVFSQMRGTDHSDDQTSAYNNLL